MDEETYRKTAVSYWSATDQRYIVVSPHFTRVVGIGDTLQEAQETFDEALDRTHRYYLTGGLEGWDSTGRPERSLETITIDLEANTSARLNDLARKFGCDLSHVIDYLVEFERDAELCSRPGDPAITKPSRR